MRALVVVMALAACSPPPPGAGPQVLVQLPAAECTSTCVHDFGLVPAFTRVSAAFDVVNVGDVESSLSVTLEGLQFSLEQPPPTTLAPRASAPFIVRVEPRVGVEISTELVVAWGDPPQTVVVILRATGVSAAPTVEPAECDFGQLPIGESRACTITVDNPGTEEVVIDEAIIEPSAFAAESVLVLPAFLQPGTALSVVIRGTAQELGRVEGALSLYPANAAEPLTIPLALEGI